MGQRHCSKMAKMVSTTSRLSVGAELATAGKLGDDVFTLTLGAEAEPSDFLAEGEAAEELALFLQQSGGCCTQ